MIDPLPRDGDRVCLRRLSRADLGEFQAYRHDEETGRYQGWLPEPDDVAGAFLREMADAPLLVAGEWVQLGIADRRSDGLLGDIGIHVAADGAAAEIGFTLRREARGKGLGAEAVREAIALIFARTEVARVVAVTDARNLASIRLLERVGMRRVETQDARFRGEPCVEHTYAIDRQGPVGRG